MKASVKSKEEKRADSVRHKGERERGGEKKREGERKGSALGTNQFT